MQEDIEKAPSIGFSLQAQLPGNRTLVTQSFIDRDCDVKDLNAVLDKIRTAVDRQLAFGMIEALRLQLEQEEKIASDHATRMAQVDANINRDWQNGGRRGDVVLSAKQRQEQAQAYAHAEECKKRIAKVKRDIAEFEARIGA